MYLLEVLFDCKDKFRSLHLGIIVNLTIKIKFISIINSDLIQILCLYQNSQSLFFTIKSLSSGDSSNILKKKVKKLYIFYSFQSLSIKSSKFFLLNEKYYQCSSLKYMCSRFVVEKYI